MESEIIEMAESVSQKKLLLNIFAVIGFHAFKRIPVLDGHFDLQYTDH